MEIKKYVLTKDNKILEIHDKSTRGYSYVDYKKEGVVFTRTILEEDITKTSDNILDLVEVGDLVEWNNYLGELVDVNINYVKYIKLDRIEWNGGAVAPKDVLAIWKRQGNTYVRYEVKE